MKKPRGRPKGSKNKPKPTPEAMASAAGTEVEAEAAVEEMAEEMAEEEAAQEDAEEAAAEQSAAAIQPSAVIESSSRRSARHVLLHVEEHKLGSDGYFAAKAHATWKRIDAWANTRHRSVVLRSQLKRLLGFTTTILLVRREDGRPHGMALLCEAPNEVDVCDSLHVCRNPSLPHVRTSRSRSFVPIRESHVRSAFDTCIASHPVDELVLICGERGSGAAIMAHLRGRQRLLFASVVPGCDRTQRFYERYFVRLPLERKDGELPHVAWLGATI